MKIEDPLTGTPIVDNRKIRGGKGKRSAASSSAGSSKDSVEITQASEQLNILADSLGQMDVTDAGKLEAVKQAVADGRFQVDEQAVADALVQSSMDQIKRKGRK